MCWLFIVQLARFGGGGGGGGIDHTAMTNKKMKMSKSVC